MRVAVIGSSHGCWACRSTEKFPGISMTERGPITLVHRAGNAHVQATWDIVASSESELTDYVNHLQQDHSMNRAQLLSHEGRRGILLSSWTHNTSSYDTLLENNALPIAPIRQEKGYDIHTVLCEDPKQLTKLMASMNEIGDTKIFKVGKFLPEKAAHGLTHKQLQAIATAVHNGYYTWPRNVTLDELAQINHVSRRAFQEHLRRGEAKALPYLLKGFLKEHAIF